MPLIFLPINPCIMEVAGILRATTIKETLHACKIMLELPSNKRSLRVQTHRSSCGGAALGKHKQGSPAQFSSPFYTLAKPGITHTSRHGDINADALKKPIGPELAMAGQARVAKWIPSYPVNCSLGAAGRNIRRRYLYVVTRGEGRKYRNMVPVSVYACMHMSKSTNSRDKRTEIPCSLTHTDIYINIHTYTYTHMHMYVCMYICMYVCTYLHIYIRPRQPSASEANTTS